MMIKSKGNILVVDDHPINLNIMVDMLTKQGYLVRPAINGEVALQSAKKFPPDLILLDIMMPGLDGYEVCHELKSDERTHDIPIIFISALEETSNKIKAFDAGGVDYITKPFSKKEVLARVKTHLALRAMHQQLEQQNFQLAQEIAERMQIEEQLSQYRERLEELVEERTARLEQANTQLRAEITERQQIEKALRKSEGQYKDLAQQNEQLLAQARQDAETKTILLNEVNHRVKNNLSAIIGLLITEQRYAGSETTYKERLTALISRIQGLAKVHTMLSASQWQPLPLAELVQQVSKAALQMVPPQQYVSVDVKGKEVKVTPEQSGSLALVINELIINSIKHALPHPQSTQTSHIQVEIEIEENDTIRHVTLTIQDDGPGYPEEVLAEHYHPKNLGLYLTKNLITRDLSGTLTLNNNNGAVTTIRFDTPVKE
jgi:DNA-binding response OmpR family regulator/anti-sigma regulatory factor (Ser/Thr protein kinase)